MNICLINPRFPPSLWDFSGCRDLDGSKFPFPPLSLATIASLTPKEHEVIIRDENVRPMDWAMDADLVGLTGYQMQKERVFELADRFRRRGIPVAIGGPIVQRSNLEACAKHADFVFLGEAENSWPAFIRDFHFRRPPSIYVQEDFVDLRRSPPPRFELLELSAYSTAIMETSRGCPQACEFCEIPIRLGRRPRTKSPEQVMREVRKIYRLGADSIFIIDDNFFGDRPRAIAILSEIEKFVRSVDYRIYFSCQFTIDISRDPEIPDLLHRANFRRVFVGIETPRESSLKKIRKHQNAQGDLLESVRRLQSHNLIVWGAFMVGLDDDDPRIFEEQFRFIQEASIPVAMVGLLQALPGTPLYERLQREGRLKDQEAGGIRGGVNGLVQTNIVPRGMTFQELAAGYRTLVRNLYRHENFAARMINAVKLGKKQGWKGRPHIHPRGIRIFLRVIRYYLLSRHPERVKMFVRVISQTLLHNPRDLESVLMHLVVYKHLKGFYEQGTSMDANP